MIDNFDPNELMNAVNKLIQFSEANERTTGYLNALNDIASEMEKSACAEFLSGDDEKAQALRNAAHQIHETFKAIANTRDTYGNKHKAHLADAKAIIQSYINVLENSVVVWVSGGKIPRDVSLILRTNNGVITSGMNETGTGLTIDLQGIKPSSITHWALVPRLVEENEVNDDARKREQD